MQISGKKNGFTLIELIISIAIISILSAIIFSNYFNQVARTQVTAALSEINPAKIAIDLKMLNGLTTELLGDDDSVAKQVGLPGKETVFCTIKITAQPSGLATVTCTLKGIYKVNGYVIQLARDATENQSTTGLWVCNTNLDESIRPKACTGTYTPQSN